MEKSTDHLGSTVVMSDSAGQGVWSGEASPFGEKVEAEGSAEERLKYTGKELDPETGLYYFNARWYEPSLGRFTTEDPARSGLAWYVYAANNPLRFVDPTGLAPRNLTEQQRERYKAAIRVWNKDNLRLPVYNSSTGNSRVGQQWDCADTATYLSGVAMAEATGRGRYYETLRDFQGRQLQDIPPINTTAFQSGELGNITFYTNDEGSIDNVWNSPNVEVGTIGVFNNHVITVTGVERDAQGNVTNIKTVQGHKAKDITWDPITSQADLDAYIGEFIGWGEIGQNSTTAAPVEASVAEASASAPAVDAEPSGLQRAWSGVLSFFGSLFSPQ